MTTRLDRLVLLLDTGSTTAVRRTAAQQLGEIQKQHPGELYNLLSRVVVHLRSKAWDTRWAAGQALEAIASNVPEWDPSPETPDNTEQDDQDNHKLRFDQFDLASVLLHGKLLLGSAGKEYDIDFSDMTPQERLELQRRNLKERLGLGSQFMDVDLVNDADLEANTKQKVAVKTNSPSPSPSTSTQLAQTAPVTPAVAEINTAGMSARERNQLKRKMRLESKMKNKKEKVRVMDLQSKPDPTPQPIKVESKEEFEFTAQPQSNKFVVEAKKQAASTDNFDKPSRDWPFKMACEHLCLDLFDPAWEIRHGAGIGLRSILKVHGNGAGKRGNVVFLIPPLSIDLQQ